MQKSSHPDLRRKRVVYRIPKLRLTIKALDYERRYMETNQQNQVLEGKIKKIFSDSGAIERCPECRRALVNDHCPVHLDVDGIEDLRVKVRLETGQKVIFNGDVIEHILGIKKSDANALPDHDVKRIIHNKFSKKPVKVEVTPISEDDQLYHVKSIKEIG